MNIAKDVTEILTLQKTSEKRSKLEQLSDVFEYGHDLSIENVAEGLKLLLAAALQEDDQSIKESLLHAITKAVVYQQVGNRINWDTLAAELPSLEIWELEYALDILGFSGQIRYLPTLEKYAHHTDPEIREWADDSIENINSRIAHAGDFHKEGKLTA